MSITHLTIILVAIILVMAVCAFAAIKKYNRADKTNDKQRLRFRGRIYCLIAVLCFMGIISMSILNVVGLSHGMHTNDMSLPKTITSVMNSPSEDNLPENKDELKGCIIIYYKFGCPDCEDIYTDLKNALNGHDKIYWVSTESTQGKELLKEYPVSDVPTGVYIRKNSYSSALKFTKKCLYTKTDGKTVLDTKGLNRLFELQKEGK